MPIVLTSNEVVQNPDHAWNDVEGVQYHYPNQYKGKIQPGERFVYYRGVHRADGRRAAAEYFGHGRIGAVWPDPATLGAARPAWFCAIEDYAPFAPPVPAKPNGVFYEAIPSNMWRSGVRSLDDATFAQILAAAGLNAEPDLGLDRPPVAIAPPRPPLESASLILPSRPASSPATAPASGGRRSRQAKQVGDWAEQAALAFRAPSLASVSGASVGLGST